jgi:hypothetical protein
MARRSIIQQYLDENQKKAQSAQTQALRYEEAAAIYNRMVQNPTFFFYGPHVPNDQVSLGGEGYAMAGYWKQDGKHQGVYQAGYYDKDGNPAGWDASRYTAVAGTLDKARALELLDKSSYSARGITRENYSDPLGQMDYDTALKQEKQFRDQVEAGLITHYTPGQSYTWNDKHGSYRKSSAGDSWGLGFFDWTEGMTPEQKELAQYQLAYTAPQAPNFDNLKFFEMTRRQEEEYNNPTLSGAEAELAAAKGQAVKTDIANQALSKHNPLAVRDYDDQLNEAGILARVMAGKL